MGSAGEGGTLSESIYIYIYIYICFFVCILLFIVNFAYVCLYNIAILRDCKHGTYPNKWNSMYLFMIYVLYMCFIFLYICIVSQVNLRQVPRLGLPTEGTERVRAHETTSAPPTPQYNVLNMKCNVLKHNITILKMKYNMLKMKYNILKLESNNLKLNCNTLNCFLVDKK
jgi:hypothetical protein